MAEILAGIATKKQDTGKKTESRIIYAVTFTVTHDLKINTIQHLQYLQNKIRLSPPTNSRFNEVLGFRPDFIEHQLAHAVRDANGRAYNRTSHLPERHKMMQAWSDYMEGLKNGAQVIAFKAKSG